MALGSSVKGITIEFSGDTTKLGKAIKDIDNKTRTVDKSLKSVDRALKFNPKNTELLAQKQQLLGQKIGDTKDRLEALKEAQAKMDDDPAVDKQSQEYMELRREIITTESKLSHFEQQLKELNNIKFEQVGQRVKEVGDKMKTVGDNMTKYVTGPIVAAGAGSIKAFNEVDAGLDIVTQKTGATGDALSDMHDIVKNLAGEIPADFETIGTAVGEVSTRFGVTGSDLEDLSSKFLRFAQINGVDVNTAVDTTQKALSAFGLSAKDAGPLLDQLNKVGQDTGASMDSLLEGLVQNGTAFQELGLDAQQSAILMGQLETSGANSETVMQGLRKALKNAAKEGVPFDEALANLQDSILNGTDGMDGLTAAYDLFGKSGDQIYGAIKNGTLDFAALGAAAGDAGGSVENTFNETLDPMDKFAMMMNDLKVVGYEVGSSLLEAFGPTLERMAKGLQGLAEKWSNLSPGMQDVIIKAGLITAALGPVISVMGRMLIGVGNLIKVGPQLIKGFGAISKAFGVLKGALLGNPWVLVAAAAVAAIVLIVKNWDKIKAFFIKLWAGVKKVFSAAWKAIKAVLLAAWNGIKVVFTTALKIIKTVILTYFNAYKTVITTIFNAIKNVVTTAWNGIKTAITTVLGAIKTAVSNGLNKIKTTVTTIFTTVKGAVSKAWNAIKSAITTPINAAKNAVSNAVSAIRSKALSVGTGIVGKIKAAFSKVKSVISEPFNKAKELVRSAINTIKGLFPLKLGKIFSGVKLPHFKIKGGKIPWGIGGKGTPPSVDIKWYKKGGIFDSPSLIGVGEAGAEAVVPLDKFWNKLDRIAEGGMGGDVIININGANADPREIAQEVKKVIIQETNRRRLAWQ